MAADLDLDLYLVTDTGMCAERGVVETVRSAVRGGVTVVQVRDPDASARELYELVLRVREVVAGTRVPVLVNDRLDVALAAGADGVHLGQSDLPVRRARALAGPDFLVGWSVSDAAELDAANSLPPGAVDYLGLGPVLGTPTKPEAAAPTGVEGLRQLVAASRLPSVAIGGVHADNAREVLDTGVDGLCVVSEICAAEDPESAAARLRKGA